MDIASLFLQTIHSIGYLGPYILFISSIYFLFDKSTSLAVYIVGFFFNLLLNIILKSLIQQPRPVEDKRLFNLEIINGKRIVNERYGMPSNHAQGVFYSTIFILLTLKNKTVGLVYLLVSLITCYQRIANNYHTVPQVFAGGIIGILMGASFYYCSKRMLKGRIREKPDDNAPYY